MRTILGIWAHPDDEVFVSGGYMADAVRRGDRVVCLHMTRGEAGLYFRKSSTPEVLSAVRQTELIRSLERLGVTEQRSLEYPDGGLALAPREEVIARLYDTLVDVRPDEIVTFGADGFTGHPDHRSLSGWVTAAVRLWNRPRARLLHATVPLAWRECIIPRLNEFDFFWPGHPMTWARPDMTFRLDDELLDAKVDAIRAHASQMQPLFDAYGESFMRSVAANEVFRVGPRPAFRARILSEMKNG